MNHKKFEDTKEVMRSRKWKDRQYNGKKTYGQWSTKHNTHTHNILASRTPQKTDWTQVLWKG